MPRMEERLVAVFQREKECLTNTIDVTRRQVKKHRQLRLSSRRNLPLKDQTHLFGLAV